MADHARHAVFRLEYGGERGWGHLVRCAALAEELRERKWSCTLWSGGTPTGIPVELRRSFSRTIIPAAKDWLAAPPAKVRGAAQLFLDLYGLTDDAVATLKSRLGDGAGAGGPGVIVIDDEARQAFPAADLILNQRLGLSASSYAARALTGERIALLRRGLRCPVPPSFSPSAGEVPVLVIFGGTDPARMTATALHALADVDGARIVPIVVRSRASAGAGEVQKALRRFARFEWIEQVDAASFAGWARVCEYAVTAAGGTLYELAFLNLPFVGVVVADNQRKQAQAVAQLWRMPVVADPADPRNGIANAIHELRGCRPGKRYSTVDDRGAARVADAIEQFTRVGA